MDTNHNTPNENPNHEKMQGVQSVSGLFENWFMDYASYVILERAVPSIQDGLKPVQRRILHSMKDMDDGRYNKVANIIGHTMQYHPHGDTSIGDAIVNIGQKDLLIDPQGNWGDVRTGDRAAASRYIEARLTKFALDVMFNSQTTKWQQSYDGRKREPVSLPVKFPLLLAQGAEGIAVGLSTKILPHNFVELIKASINCLKGKSVKIYPDFATGGMADFSDYNDGKRGGKVRVRAKIEIKDKKTLLIKEIPFSTTTSSLIDSIVKANDKGKIKIKSVIDNTAKDVEIQILLAPNQYPEVLIDALYAFTDCEVSISPNACIIDNDKPHFVTVVDVLKQTVDQTLFLLKQELLIKEQELKEKLLFSSLEKIFIENRIYRDIEECETWEAVLQTIDKGLTPYKPDFYREIKEEDIVRLTEIKIKRISKFDTFKANELMNKLSEELEKVKESLNNLVDYAIAYYNRLLETYGKGKERKTEITNFQNIQANIVAANNTKLYVNRKEGFIGTGLKKDEFVCECSDIDDIIIFRSNGTCMVSKINDKTFVGKDIIHVDVFKKNDQRKVYNMIYLDAEKQRSMAKRFQVLSVTRDREYELVKGGSKSKVLYFSANANGEAELLKIKLTQGANTRHKIFEYDFSELAIKGRVSGGNIVSKFTIQKNGIIKLSEGQSTLGGVQIWYDSNIGRLNNDGRGKLLGKFTDEQILVVYLDGSYELTNFELTNRYETKEILHIEQFNPEKILSVIYFDGNSKATYVKRFQIETTSQAKRFKFISEHRSSKLLLITSQTSPQVELTYVPTGSKEVQTGEYDLEVLGSIKGWRALGNKLGIGKIKKMTLISSEPIKKEENEEESELGVKKDEQNGKDQLGLF